MTKYAVQFELPVDNPVNKVRMKRSKACITFYVPINHPDIQLMTYSDLVAAVEKSGLLHLSTPLNINTEDSSCNTIKPGVKKKSS